jgi:hypothetical protein
MKENPGNPLISEVAMSRKLDTKRSSSKAIAIQPPNYFILKKGLFRS